MTFITQQQQLDNLVVLEDWKEAKKAVIKNKDLILERVRSRIEVVETLTESFIEGRLPYYTRTFIPILELIGSGGHDRLGTNYEGSTERLHLYRGCGSGRVFAKDGAAWDAALWSYCEETLGGEFAPTIQVFGNEVVIFSGSKVLFLGDRSLLSLLLEADDYMGMDPRNGLLGRLRGLLHQVKLAVGRNEKNVYLRVNDCHLAIGDSVFARDHITIVRKLIDSVEQLINSKL